jgi:hypothetical protein
MAAGSFSVIRITVFDMASIYQSFRPFQLQITISIRRKQMAAIVDGGAHLAVGVVSRIAQPK